MSLIKRAAVPVVILALLVAAGFTMFNSTEQKDLTAYFPRTVAVYQGSEVRVLGVPVGKVDSVVPQGTQVKVTMHYDADLKIPDDAKAVIIAPSIVGDRYVQLTPVYTDGAVLADGAVLPEDRTAVPLELDQVYSSLDQLTVALGPNGANKNGALSDLLEVTAANFGGQGAMFHRTIGNFSKLSQTLDDNKEELFGSARALESFVNTLATNDTTVRKFNKSLAAVSTELSGEREELAATLKNLSIGLGQVASFVRENRDVLSRNITGLNRIARILVKRRDALDETLTDAPIALGNLYLTYNPDAGTLDTAGNVGELFNQVSSDPALVLCTIAEGADPTGALCDLIKQSVGRTGTFGAAYGTGSSAGKQFDQTLGGLVEAQR